MDQEMFVSEAFQGLDMAFTNALTSMRKTIWDVFTTKIAELKDKAAQLRNECSDSFEDLKIENHNLSKKLEVTEHVLQGKELEIYALRHQIRSLLSGRPVCNNCSQEIVVPDVHLQSNLRLIDDRRPTTLSAVSVPRKRTLLNASLSSSTITAELSEVAIHLPNTMHSRPSQKRRCLSDLNAVSGASKPGSQTLSKAKVLVAETQDLDSEPNSRAARMQPVGPYSRAGDDKNADDSNSDNEPSTQSAPTLTNASPAPTNLARADAALREPSLRLRMRLASLSPPTQTSFNASEAIRRAVNHQDINDDITMPRSRLLQQTSTVSVSRDGQHSRKLIHKPTCRYFSSKKRHQKQQRKQSLSKARKSDSDATGADLTLPTESLAAEVTVDVDTASDMNAFSATEAHQPPSKKPETDSETRENGKVNDYEDLPSVGGSPSKTGVTNKPILLKSGTDHAQLNADSSATAYIQPSSQNIPSDPVAATAVVPVFDSLSHLTTSDRETSSTPVNVLKPPPPSPVTTGSSAPQTHTCMRCFDYYRAVGYSEAEIRKRISRTGHGHNHLKDVTPSTPNGFWNLTLSSQPNTEQALPADDNVAPRVAGEASAGEQERWAKNLRRRRRPLHFPGEVTPSLGRPSR